MRNRTTQLLTVEQGIRSFAHETAQLNLAAGVRERARRGRVTPSQFGSAGRLVRRAR